MHGFLAHLVMRAFESSSPGPLFSPRADRIDEGPEATSTPNRQQRERAQPGLPARGFATRAATRDLRSVSERSPFEPTVEGADDEPAIEPATIEPVMREPASRGPATLESTSIASSAVQYSVLEPAATRWVTAASTAVSTGVEMLARRADSSPTHAPDEVVSQLLPATEIAAIRAGQVETHNSAASADGASSALAPLLRTRLDRPERDFSIAAGSRRRAAPIGATAPSEETSPSAERASRAERTSLAERASLAERGSPAERASPAGSASPTESASSLRRSALPRSAEAMQSSVADRSAPTLEPILPLAIRFAQMPQSRRAPSASLPGHEGGANQRPVHVTIGRVEVRAVASPVRGQTPARARQRPTLSLSDYLSRKNGERR
jgi:hypothetical protein